MTHAQKTVNALTSDLRQHAAADPNRVAIACDGEALSYGALDAMASRMAASFRACGLLRGDHVATLVGNRPEMLAAAWAAWRAGVYLTPMPTSLAQPEVEYLLRDCDAKLILADGEFASLAEPLTRNSEFASVHRISTRGSVRGFTPLAPLLAAVAPLPVEQEMPGALMMYTSGTTGAPKGVFRPLLPAGWHGTPPFASDLIQLFGVGGHDVRYLSTAPLYHAAPLRFALAVTAGGGTVHVMGKFDAARALGILQKERITHSQWVPAMFQRMLALPQEQRLAFQAPAHRCAIHGAAPCPAELKRRMIDWWGPILLEYYSGSEGVGLTSIDSIESLRRPGSVGRAKKGTIHIVGEQGENVGSGEVGRIFFSGTSPFEYYKVPEKTASRTHANGWQTFGDVGYVDQEGYLFLTDRSEDMIISGGMNIYPQEIETVIRTAPGVGDCAVIGVDDESFGERPIAFIEVTGDDVPAVTEAVRLTCLERLGRFKQPAHIIAIAQLPRGPTGKLLRRKLREQIPTLQTHKP